METIEALVWDQSRPTLEMLYADGFMSFQDHRERRSVHAYLFVRACKGVQFAAGLSQSHSDES